MGNSTGLVLTMRTTLPDPGVSKMQKNGRSQPSSVYSSMTCFFHIEHVQWKVQTDKRNMMLLDCFSLALLRMLKKKDQDPLGCPANL